MVRDRLVACVGVRVLCLNNALCLTLISAHIGWSQLASLSTQSVLESWELCPSTVSDLSVFH